MTFNVFEGARRISLLIAVLATAGTLFSLVTYEPRVDAKYSVFSPGSGFVKQWLSCPREAREHSFSSTISTGQRVSVNLCLVPMAFGDDRLVPYKIDNEGKLWGADHYSSEVTSYALGLESQFQIPKEDEAEVLRKMSKDYRDYWLSGLGYLALGLSIFAAFVWTAGWIVRGFFGIPRGYDRKPESAED